MPCYSPLNGWMRQDVSGRKFTMSTPRAGGDYTAQSVPCGQCVGCRLDRSRQWAVRCMHESKLWKHNCFITLTYAPEHLPANGSLVYDDFQKFMKRFRKAHSGLQPSAEGHFPIRFYMAGEYGSNGGRPHYHACIFNYDFPDRKFFMETGSKSKIYRSKMLEELWPFGFSSVGDVDFKSAAYVARYIMKKITGDASHAHYDGRVPEFNKMSLKPGIGFEWFAKYFSDVYAVDAFGDVHKDFVIVNGKPIKAPRFYDRKFKDMFPDDWERVAFSRESRCLNYVESKGVWLPDAEFQADNTPARLKSKEICTDAKLSLLKRSL